MSVSNCSLVVFDLRKKKRNVYNFKYQHGYINLGNIILKTIVTLTFFENSQFRLQQCTKNQGSCCSDTMQY